MSHRPIQRLTRSTRSVLEVLFDAAPNEQWGYDISRETGLKGGSLYPVFRRLEDAGLAESRWEADGAAESQGRPRRRYYKLTSNGVAYCMELGVAKQASVAATPEVTT